MSQTPTWKLDSFSWLRIELWTPENLFNFYEVAGKRMCKLCDEWTIRSKEVAHCDKHRQERADQLAARSEEAKENRLEALKLARAEKMLQKLIKEKLELERNGGKL